MERSFFCVGNLGSEPAVNQSSVMPVSAATFYTADMSPQFQDCYFYIEFYSDAAGTTAVTPTAGTITPQGAPYKNSWLYSPDATSISATSVIAGNATYTPPSFHGMMTRGKVTLSGITGADYFRAWFWRA